MERDHVVNGLDDPLEEFEYSEEWRDIHDYQQYDQLHNRPYEYNEMTDENSDLKDDNIYINVSWPVWIVINSSTFSTTNSIICE